MTPTAFSDSTFKQRHVMDATLLEAVKTFEGFTPQAFWDYKQVTNGYGTRAAHGTETISRAEAERRLAVELEGALNLVEKFAPTLEPGTKRALASLTFNAGTAWMKSGLGQAVLREDFDEARKLFLQYTKAGGKELPGLVARRNVEVQWFGAVQNAQATQAIAAGWQQETIQPTQASRPISAPTPVSAPAPAGVPGREASSLPRLASTPAAPIATAPPQLSQSVLEYLAMFDLELPSILEHTHENDDNHKPKTVAEA